MIGIYLIVGFVSFLVMSTYVFNAGEMTEIEE